MIEIDEIVVETTDEIAVTVTHELRDHSALAESIPARPEIDARSPIGDVVRSAIIGSVTRLLDHETRVLDGSDPEALHQARTSVRRLRSDLRTFREVLEPAWGTSSRAELGWLGRELGAVRDVDVLRDRLARDVDRLPAADRSVAHALLERVDAWRETMRVALATAITTDRYERLVERLVEAAHEPALTDDAQRRAKRVLTTFVDGQWRHLRGAVEDLGPNPDDGALHLVRIRAKRARYAAEASVGVVGKPARRFARHMAAIQDVLGDYRDATAANAWLTSAVADSTHRETFVAGALAQQERDAARAARAAFPDVWERARRKSLRRWFATR